MHEEPCAGNHLRGVSRVNDVDDRVVRREAPLPGTESIRRRRDPARTVCEPVVGIALEAVREHRRERSLLHSSTPHRATSRDPTEATHLSSLLRASWRPAPRGLLPRLRVLRLGQVRPKRHACGACSSWNDHRTNACQSSSSKRQHRAHERARARRRPARTRRRLTLPRRRIERYRGDRRPPTRPEPTAQSCGPTASSTFRSRVDRCR